jgi:hypothetical protein
MFLGIDLGASGVLLLLSADMHRIAVAASDGRSIRQTFSVLPKKLPATRETACIPPAIGGSSLAAVLRTRRGDRRSSIFS